MIHARAFPGWADLIAFLAHIAVYRSLTKIHRLAVVSDSSLLTEIPKIAAHLVRAEVKAIPGICV